jgi:hypothetical protein
MSKTGGSKPPYVTSEGTEIHETLDISFSKYEPLRFRTATGDISYGFKLAKKLWVNPQPAVSMNMMQSHAKQSLREQEPSNLLKIKSKLTSKNQMDNSSHLSSQDLPARYCLYNIVVCVVDSAESYQDWQRALEPYVLQASPIT